MTSNALNISIHNVTKTYGDFYALKDVSLDVTSGEFLTLLGPSGSGLNKRGALEYLDCGRIGRWKLWILESVGHERY